MSSPSEELELRILDAHSLRMELRAEYEELRWRADQEVKTGQQLRADSQREREERNAARAARLLR